jgi:hypothetical protein
MEPVKICAVAADSRVLLYENANALRAMSQTIVPWRPETADIYRIALQDCSEVLFCTGNVMVCTVELDGTTPSYISAANLCDMAYGERANLLVAHTDVEDGRNALSVMARGRAALPIKSIVRFSVSLAPQMLTLPVTGGTILAQGFSVRI